jgi:hypothetical protein
MDENRKSRFLGIAAAVVSLTAVGALVYHLYSKHPVNVHIGGVVKDEKELYGSVVSGYATERKGVMGKVESVARDIVRPGAPMKLYVLEPTIMEYDTRHITGRKHHIVQINTNDISRLFESNMRQTGDEGVLYLQTEGDVADIGDRFSAAREELGRISKAFAVRGIRFNYVTSDGTERTKELRAVLKEANVHFYKD